MSPMSSPEEIAPLDNPNEESIGDFYARVTDRELLEAIHFELAQLNQLRINVETYGPQAIEKLKSNPFFSGIAGIMEKMFRA